MDIDNLLKYMAVHVFSVNEDSLSGSMAHNYYLYEHDGRLNILPWDYNLALGGMGSGNDATSTINDAIDGAFSGTKFFDTLMENEKYEAQYHAYLQQLVDEYINGGGFDKFYTKTRSQIDSLVETDPTAFYTYDEYIQATEMLYEVVKLRGESINGQLDGSIPSTASEQRGSDALIDASQLDLSVMGVMNMGGGFNFGGRSQGKPDASDEDTGNGKTVNMTDTASSGAGASITLLAATSRSNGAGTDSVQPGGTMPEGIDPSQFGGQAPGSTAPSDETGSTASSGESEKSEDSSLSGGNKADDSQTFRQNFDPSAMGVGGSRSSSTFQMTNLTTYGICFAVLLAALLFAKLYRRKPKRR